MFCAIAGCFKHILFFGLQLGKWWQIRNSLHVLVNIFLKCIYCSCEWFTCGVEWFTCGFFLFSGPSVNGRFSQTPWASQLLGRVGTWWGGQVGLYGPGQLREGCKHWGGRVDCQITALGLAISLIATTVSVTKIPLYGCHILTRVHLCPSLMTAC